MPRNHKKVKSFCSAPLSPWHHPCSIPDALTSQTAKKIEGRKTAAAAEEEGSFALAWPLAPLILERGGWLGGSSAQKRLPCTPPPHEGRQGRWWKPRLWLPPSLPPFPLLRSPSRIGMGNGEEGAHFLQPLLLPLRSPLVSLPSAAASLIRAGQRGTGTLF